MSGTPAVPIGGKGLTVATLKTDPPPEVIVLKTPPPTLVTCVAMLPPTEVISEATDPAPPGHRKRGN